MSVIGGGGYVVRWDGLREVRCNESGLTSRFCANHNCLVKLICLIVILEPKPEHPTLNNQNTDNQFHRPTTVNRRSTHVSGERMEKRNQHLVIRTRG